MFSDLKSAWRYVRAQPGFSLFAIVSLAVTIGVNAAMFSVVNGFLLRDAVSQDPARYVGVFTATQDAARSYRPFSLAEFTALRADRSVFADVSAVHFSQVALGEPGAIRRAFAFLVSDNFFALAGTQPALGRFFTPAEAAANSGAAVVVVSHRLWQAHGSRPDFIGQTLRLNGRACTVIGVAAPGFSGASPLLAPEVWLPLGFFRDVLPAFSATRAASDLAAPGNFALQLFARLRPDLTRVTAAPLLPVVARRLAASENEPTAGPRELVLARPLGIAPEPARESAFGPVTALTLGLSSLVLIVACLNLSNLLLARGATRRAEIATRLALGASRARIIRQLLAEGLLLGFAGGALGIAGSLWAGSFLAQVLADRVSEFGFQVVATFEPDARVVAATAVASLLACLAFSLGPALRASRLDLARDLKTGASGAIPGAGRSLWSGRNLLLLIQTAVSFVLLATAGLFLRAAVAAVQPPAGLDSTRRAVAELDFSLAPTAALPPRERALAALAAVRAEPGVEAAGLASLAPFANDVQIARASLPDASARSSGSTALAAFSAVSSGYIDTVAALRRGRDFTSAEESSPQAARVCLVDEGLAARLFPGEDALGRAITLRGGPGRQVNGNFTIVGIVAPHSQDVADRARPLARVFVPLAQVDHPVWYLVARHASHATGADALLAAALPRALRAADRDLPLVATKTMTDFLAANFSRWQAELAASLFSFFGLVAAALAAIGLYGVTAYHVSRRTREIGVRLALGAAPADVARLIVGRCLGQCVAALALGGIGAVAVATALTSFVPDMRAFDPLVLGSASVVLLLASLSALALPARRAMRISPLVALRAE